MNFEARATCVETRFETMSNLLPTSRIFADVLVCHLSLTFSAYKHNITQIIQVLTNVIRSAKNCAVINCRRSGIVHVVHSINHTQPACKQYVPLTYYFRLPTTSYLLLYFVISFFPQQQQQQHYNFLFFFQLCTSFCSLQPNQRLKKIICKTQTLVISNLN